MNNNITSLDTSTSSKEDPNARRGLPASLKVYFALLLVLAVLSGISIYLPQGDIGGMPAGQEMPASKPVMALAVTVGIFVVYGGLGLLGLTLARKLGFADIIDPRVSDRQRYLTPALIGAGLGVFFILADFVFSRFHSLGLFAHPPFPTSLVASATAGIGEEILFRLFLIPLWVWLISGLLLRGRFQTPVFWLVTTFSAVAFTAGHLPALMILLGLEMGQFQLVPLPVLVEMFLLNGTLSFFAAYYFRKYGFLAAVGIHFWADIIWHVIWGLLLTL